LLLLTVSTEHGALEAAPRAQQLPLDLVADAADLLCNERHCIAILIVHGVLGGLLKAQDDSAPVDTQIGFDSVFIQAVELANKNSSRPCTSAGCCYTMPLL
jgi:hypothetical protein